jgi:hypothetical protein
VAFSIFVDPTARQGCCGACIDLDFDLIDNFHNLSFDETWAILAQVYSGNGFHFYLAPFL